MSGHWRSRAGLVAFLVGFEGFVVLLGLSRPYWGDEAHFVQTIRRFAHGITLDTLRHYPEMSTPLPFVLYAVWGRLLGLGVESLRLLSVLIALLTYVAFHALVRSACDDGRIAFLATAFLALHPYMVGLSVFVFTDMLAILCVILGCIAVQRDRPVMFGLSSAAGLLCRQYVAFFTLASGLYYLARWVRGRETRVFWMLASTGLSVTPLLLLCAVWGGLSPDNALRRRYAAEAVRFHFGFLALYVVQLCAYVLPILAVRWRAFYTDSRILTVSLALSGVYWVFPVRPAAFAAQSRFPESVGFFDRAVRFAVGDRFHDLALYPFFLLGLPVLLTLLTDGARRLRAGRVGFLLFLDLSVVAYFVVMPFSYLAWEKYFLLVMPLVVLRMLLWRQEDLGATAAA